MNFLSHLLRTNFIYSSRNSITLGLEFLSSDTFLSSHDALQASLSINTVNGSVLAILTKN